MFVCASALQYTGDAPNLYRVRFNKTAGIENGLNDFFKFKLNIFKSHEWQESNGKWSELLITCCISVRAFLSQSYLGVSNWITSAYWVMTLAQVNYCHVGGSVRLTIEIYVLCSWRVPRAPLCWRPAYLGVVAIGTECGDAVPREVVCPRPCPAHQAWPLPAPAAVKKKHIHETATQTDRNSSNNHKTT